MKTRRMSRVLAVALCLAAAASAAPLTAQDEPSFDGLEKIAAEPQADAPVADQAPSAPDTQPSAAAEPGIPSNFLQELSTTAAAGKDFDPAKDTPAFDVCEAAGLTRRDPRNFAANLLTAEWFQRLVIPVENRDSWSRYVDLRGSEVARMLSEKGLITAADPERYRLRPYSVEAGHRENLIEKAQGFDQDFGTWFNSEKSLDAYEILSRIQADIADEKSQVALVNLYSTDQSEGRSLLAYRIEDAELAIPGQMPSPAWKVYFYDPASPLAAGESSANNYICFVKTANCWSLSPAWADAARLRTGAEYLSGPWLSDGQLRFQPANGAASRWSRNFHHRDWQASADTGN